ncbi:MAG: TrkA family potassium uptake protein [bacterium]
MRVIIVGCGRMGSELTHQLIEDGQDVTVVDVDPRTFDRLGPGFKGKTVAGSGLDREVLARAGAEQADALAAVTAKDNRNIIIARVARNTFNVPKIVARLYDPRRAEIYQRLGLQTVSSTGWGASRIIQLLGHRELNIFASLGSGEVELVEVEVPPHWVGRTVNNVNVPSEIAVTSVARKGGTFIPITGTTFQSGDRLVITVLATARSRIESLLAIA